ncbi:MAG: ATP-binding protein [Anaerolineales bacterium]|jgi:signal transduction histidine kinase/CheY-like chemotaxis protein|nr:ATP-binding protein [Anaerolineales bacterium]
MTTDPRRLPKLLYIEDNPESRSLVRRMLADEFIVLEADNPLDGLELAVDTQPDLVLLDINLPQMSGREVAARLRTLLPNTPLVAYSADDSPLARERTLAAGFAGYLDKSIDIEGMAETLREFLGGKRETVANAGNYQQDFASEVVARLESKIRELTRSAERNEFLNEQNRRMIILLQRRQRLLEAGARVGQIITSILDLDELLNVTVRVVCEEYGFAGAAVFLIDASGQWAELKAGHNANFGADRLRVEEDALVGAAIRQREIQITSNEMTLPLVVKDQPVGALSVHSNPEEPLTEDDQAAFQTLANQAAIAINNARLLRDLNQANQEILRNKTLQAIATATGEAIHWVGNKAAPIPASTKRVREDLLEMAVLFRSLLANADKKTRSQPGWDAAQEIFITLAAARPAAQLPAQPLPLGLESMLEDLEIIEQSAQTILDIKEDLIGPARLRSESQIDLAQLIRKTISEMGLPEQALRLELAENLPPVLGDARQLGQVFNNLVKNAWEALAGRADPQITIRVKLDESGPTIISEIQDNGPGIPPDLLERIWVSFFTTKGSHGGTGLGLSACMEIVNQARGKISVQSAPGQGATFTVELPVMES